MSRENRTFKNRECCHIVVCADEAACAKLEKEQIVRIKERNRRWAKSAWGNMPDWLRLTAVGNDLYNALGNGLTDAQMAAVRAALGEERFRALLNACERSCSHVSETLTLAPVVLP